MKQHRSTRITACVVSLLLCAGAGRLMAQDSTSVTDSAGVDSAAVDSTAPAAAIDSAAAVDSSPSSGAAVAPAQAAALHGDTTVVVDRVLAVVANRPVLASQVDEEIFSRQAQGAKLPTDPAQLDSLRRQVISTIVDEELLVQQASRDTVDHGDRPGDRRRRGAAGSRRFETTSAPSWTTGTSSRRRASRRRKSTAAGSPTSSVAPRCRIA